MELILEFISALAVFVGLFSFIIWSIKLKNKIPEVNDVSLDYTSWFLPTPHS